MNRMDQLVEAGKAAFGLTTDGQTSQAHVDTKALAPGKPKRPRYKVASSLGDTIEKILNDLADEGYVVLAVFCNSVGTYTAFLEYRG